MKAQHLFPLVVSLGIGLAACGGGEHSDQQSVDSTKAGAMTQPAAQEAAFSGGIYQGTVPGGTSQKKVSIALNSDSTFAFTETYLDKAGKTEHEMTSKGKWRYDADARKIYLVYENLADRGTSFSIVDEKTIQMHDAGMHAQSTTGNEYNLTKQ